MTQAKFTKGPWMLEYGDVKHRPSSIRAIEGGVSILRASAFCRVAAKETRANAHLMVAAPEMYEALSLISGWLCCAPMISDPAEFQKSAAVFFEEAEKALSKARGEQ